MSVQSKIERLRRSGWRLMVVEQDFHGATGKYLWEVHLRRKKSRVSNVRTIGAGFGNTLGKALSNAIADARAYEVEVGVVQRGYHNASTGIEPERRRTNQTRRRIRRNYLESD